MVEFFPEDDGDLLHDLIDLVLTGEEVEKEGSQAAFVFGEEADEELDLGVAVIRSPGSPRLVGCRVGITGMIRWHFLNTADVFLI